MDKLSVAREALGKIARAYDDWSPDAAFASTELFQASKEAKGALAALAQPAPDECRHSRQIDEPNGWTVCQDCDANIVRWASRSILAADGVAALTPAPQPADGGETCPDCGRAFPPGSAHGCYRGVLTAPGTLVSVSGATEERAIAAERERIASFVERYPSPLNDLPMAMAIRDLAAAIRGGAE